MKKKIKRTIASFLLLIFLITFTGVATACSTEDPAPPIETPSAPDDNNDNNENESNMQIQIKIGTNTYTATLAATTTAKAFKEMLPLTVNMSELNRNEKYYHLPGTLPTAASNPGTIRTGDLMLYGNNYLVLFYKTFTTSYSYTPIGTIDNTAGLEAALGTGSVTVTFEVI